MNKYTGNKTDLQGEKMEQKGDFKRIDKSEKRMYGPRGLLVCGYAEEERSKFLDFISKINMDEIPVIFAVEYSMDSHPMPVECQFLWCAPSQQSS